MSTDKKTSRRLPVRGWLRIAGPAMVLVGLVLLAVSSIDFFAGRQSVSVQFSDEEKAARSIQPPEYRWACYVGVPLVLIGIVVTSMGFDRLFASGKDEDEGENPAKRRTLGQPLGQWTAQRTGKRGADKGNRKA